MENKYQILKHPLSHVRKNPIAIITDVFMSHKICAINPAPNKDDKTS
jgi:hypothetical protein